MLGIRHYKSVAIDLYQGDIGCFVSDAMLFGVNKEMKATHPMSDEVLRVGGVYEKLSSSSGSPLKFQNVIELPSGKLSAQKIFFVILEDMQETVAFPYEILFARLNDASCYHRHVSIDLPSFMNAKTNIEKLAADFLKSIKNSASQESKNNSNEGMGVNKRITLCCHSDQQYQLMTKMLEAIIPDSLVMV